ncbi:multiple C2 and transmembrane domain-containing protein-like isoform X1 [Trichoplusia ni]|uniref:Multiple C2 and transmembrane domain-containing protein-like isoform X1 n=1 Tax=Trichoplusia ni TaxID=7111 RepID=A0A7E5VGJ9_TRINI|nr:multiple C2 and transmembrane domain-containing protein-like isoform X1 [Trichoplusia ni]
MAWRISSFLNVASDVLRRSNPVLESIPTPVAVDTTKQVEAAPEPTVEQTSLEKPRSELTLRRDKAVRNTIVNIVIVEAKGLPDSPDDRNSHGVYCKFRMGSQTHKSKSVPTTRHPQWREKLKLNLCSDQLLHISLWDKGKQKNFMGSCVLDLSLRERERTHDIWQDLDEGFGSIHLSVTICSTRQKESNEVANIEPNVEDWQSKYAFYSVPSDLCVVGQLHVKVIGAKGLCGKPSAYCTIELDNEKIQTPYISSTAEPVWNKSYVFNIYDVTSVLELKVCDSSINSILGDFLGRVSIPLLRIDSGEVRWYALKDNNKRRIAKGNCPRVRLEMNLCWNPVIASLKLFRPKQVKYIAKPPKFDIPLIYKNVKFIRDTFNFLFAINESFKRLFEWEDREYSTTVLCSWLVFWYYFHPWMTPLLIAALFPVVWFLDAKQRTDSRIQNGDDSNDHEEEVQNGESMKDKIKGLPEMTLTITDGIEYMVSVAERLHNLAKFKVPYLSYLAIVLLIGSAGVLYFIPIGYLMMAFGLYKYGRKRINPTRVLNNDLLDFISRIPDNKILKDWKELNVPEPNHYHQRLSASTSVTPDSKT